MIRPRPGAPVNRIAAGATGTAARPPAASTGLGVGDTCRSGHTGRVRTTYRPWITYLLLGLFLASQVPFLIRDAEWLRAGLLAAGAVLFLTVGVVRTRRRAHGRAEDPSQ